MEASHVGHLAFVTPLILQLLHSAPFSESDDDDDGRFKRSPAPKDEYPRSDEIASSKAVMSVLGMAQVERSVSFARGTVGSGASTSRGSARPGVSAAAPPRQDLRDEDRSELIEWLYLVRQACFCKTREFRSDVTLSQPLSATRAPVIGIGSTFVVRRWKRGGEDLDLAIKRVKGRSPEDRRALLKILRVEMEVLTHPKLHGSDYVVRLEAVEWEVKAGMDSPPWPILITEYADFADLASYQSRRLTLRYEMKLSLCLDVALGLRALHMNGIIHGDIKSENVLLFRHPSRGMIAKLSDFAFSISDMRRGEKRELTGGTFPYTAPEIDLGTLLGASAMGFDGLRRTDIYSLGILVWRTLLNGQSPFTWFTFTSEDGRQISPQLHNMTLKADPDFARQAVETIQLASRTVCQDLKPQGVRPALESSIQVSPKARDIKAVILTLAKECGRMQSEEVKKVESSLRHYQEQDYERELDFDGTEDDHVHMLVRTLERNPLINMPILLDFHPFEQKHSAIQRYILRALEELSHNHSDRSNIIKLYLFFIHFCGFGNAVAQNLGLALKYLQEACLGYFQSMTKKDEEHRMNALAMVVAGTPLEAIPMNDMSAFIVQIEGVSEAKKGNLPDLRGYEQGVTQNAESGSPIAREILKTHFRGIFDRLQSPTHPLRSVDKIDEDHVLELELPMDRLREFEQMVASHPEIPWKRHFKDIPGLDGLSHHGDTYLHLAAQHGYTAVVCELLANFPDTGFENLGNFRKETPLLQAAKAGHFAICQALLDAGADVRAESIYRETALHWACSFTAETDIKSFVGTLVDWGADLTAVAGQKSYGMMDTYRSYGTPLERAVARNNAQAVKVLLEVGKNQEKDLITTEAVHVAAKFHFAQCLELLLNACGRRLGSSRVKGMNLMGSAIFGLPVWQWMNWHGMVHEKAARDTIELLLKAGIDTRIVAIFTPNGESFPVQFSAVGAAAAVGSANMLTVLLKRGIPPDVEFDPEHVGFEYPPLYEAMSRGYRDAFLTLLAHGADVNMTRPMIGGDNYLHLCAYHHWDLFFARELLQRGADVNRGNPFYAAVLASNFELADVLLKHGADMQGRLPNIGMTLLGDLLTLVPEVSKEHLEYVLSKASSTENDGQSPFVVLKSMNVTALHMACTLDFKGDHQFHDLQTLAEDRRIIEFLLEKGPKEHLNAKTDEGHTALILAVTSGHLEAARLLLEAGVGEVKDWVQCFKLIVTKLSQAVPENIFSGGEKAKSTYRQRQADIAVLLSNYLPHGQVLSVNCYSTRLQEVREREGMGILPLRASWISAKKYYLDDFVRSNTTTQNRVSMPRLGKHPRMFQSYMEDVMVSLAGSLPAFWFMSRPQRATEKALAGVRRALWEILDVDWVVLVVTDGRFLSRSKRLMILQNSIQDMLSPAFVLKLKLAGTGKKFELLYKVTLKQDGDGQDSNEEHYYGELVTWIPPFEEGRTWEDLDKWEDFVGRLGLEDMDMFAYMKKAKYEETDWAAEIGRVAHETVKTDSSDEEEEESGSDDSSDDQYHDDTSDSEDEQML